MVDARLDGATALSPENGYPSDPGEFAADWNSWGDERRREFLARMVENSQIALRHLMRCGVQNCRNTRAETPHRPYSGYKQDHPRGSESGEGW